MRTGHRGSHCWDKMRRSSHHTALHTGAFSSVPPVFDTIVAENLAQCVNQGQLFQKVAYFLNVQKFQRVPFPRCSVVSVCLTIGSDAPCAASPRCRRGCCGCCAGSRNPDGRRGRWGRICGRQSLMGKHTSLSDTYSAYSAAREAPNDVLLLCLPQQKNAWCLLGLKRVPGPAYSIACQHESSYLPPWPIDQP